MASIVIVEEAAVKSVPPSVSVFPHSPSLFIFCMNWLIIIVVQLHNWPCIIYKPCQLIIRVEIRIKFCLPLPCQQFITSSSCFIHFEILNIHLVFWRSDNVWWDTLEEPLGLSCSDFPIPLSRPSCAAMFWLKTLPLSSGSEWVVFRYCPNLKSSQPYLFVLSNGFCGS